MSGDVIRYVPVTPGGTACIWLASKSEAEAWRRLLWSASHMPYKGVEEFKKRGYAIERQTWSSQ